MFTDVVLCVGETESHVNLSKNSHALFSELLLFFVKEESAQSPHGVLLD